MMGDTLIPASSGNATVDMINTGAWFKLENVGTETATIEFTVTFEAVVTE